MYEGYLKFGASEALNIARTMAYVKAGIVAPGVFIDAPTGYDGLRESLGDAEYRTPALDAAPWFDPANPDTAEFAGVLPLSVTGLDGTTRAVTVTDRTGDGGTASAPRRSSRTIAVSALLVGRDGAGAAAGLEWLTTTLHRSCEGDSDCEGTDLSGFLVCPTVEVGEDMDAALVAATYARDTTWLAYGGTWTPSTGEFLAAEFSVASIDGGSPSTEDTDDVDGGVVGDEVTGEVDGGDSETAATPRLLLAHLALPEVLGCVSHVEVVWTVSTLAGDPDDTVNVRLGAVDETGAELERGDLITVTDTATAHTWVREFAPWEAWRPAIWTDSPGVTVTASATIRTRPLLPADDCIAPYRRSFAQVVCVDGPNVVQAWQSCDESGGADLLQVEWTWVAGDPYRYGDPINFVTGLPLTENTAPTSEVEHVGHTYVGTVSATDTDCPAPSEPITCATDPTYPGFITPPTAPVIVDPGATNPSSYTRQQVSIDPALVPDTGAAALRFVFVNTATTKRGVRVRLYHFPEGGGVPEECAFEDEFWINYIPASAILVVDGIAGKVTVECIDNTSANARRVMRGPYKGAFTFPTLRCGGAYLLSIDTPDSTGGMTVTIDAAPREG
jgi:hypothetical protein